MISKDKKKLWKKFSKLLDTRVNAPIRDERILLHRTTGDIDHTLHQWIVNAGNPDQALDILDNEGYSVYGEDFNSPYDCTGRPFCDPATIKKYTDDRYYVALDVHYDV